MPYSALARRLLVSCPGRRARSRLGDCPTRDSSLERNLRRSVRRRRRPDLVGTHAAAEFGEPPQDILNRQLVDRCDICIALFANRLGTPTVVAESGTAEEIERIGKSERYVGILRSRRPVDIGRIDLEQARNLDEYLARIRQNALVLDYATDDELSERVDTILAAAVARDQGRADLQLSQAAGHTFERVAEVWPRVDSSESTTSFSGGRDIVRRKWYLVLSNTGDGRS